MITLLGEKGDDLCASHAFVCFVHVSFVICRFLLVWFVIVALPGLFY